MSRPSLVWLSLGWPHEVTPEQVRGALLALHGLSTPRRRDSWLLQTQATATGLEHMLAIPEPRTAAVTERLRQAIPGLQVEVVPAPAEDWRSCWVIWLSSRKRPLRTSDPELVAGGLLTALSAVQSDERLALRWVLGPVRRPIAVPTTASQTLGEPVRDVLATVLGSGRTLDPEARTALLRKQGEPGWRAAGRLSVQAATSARQHQLLARVSGALRSAAGPGVEIGAHRPLLYPVGIPWWRPLALNLGEMVGLAAWPVGNLEGLPVVRIAARATVPSRAVPRRGRVIGEATYPGHERPVAVSVRDSLSHLWLAGPTGSGKSSLMAVLAEADLKAGRAVVVIDPKGDLITQVLARVPLERQGDVVVLDAADELRPVGLNPLAAARRQPEVVADQLLGLFRSLSGEAWGPRVADVMQAGLLTVAQLPEASLCHLPVLLSDPSYRRRAVAQLDDPFGLGPFWTAFEALSPNEREQSVAPVLRRLRQLLLRPRMRAVLGQVHPRFELAQVFTERKILLVSLAKGLLGPEASALLGSLVVNQLWQTILARTAIPAEQRHPVMVFIDEVQDQLHGITDLGELLAQARGLGVGVHAAHQHLGQLDPSLKSALAANARSRIIFQTAADDAAFFARGQSVLRPEDFQRLPRLQAYASLLAGGQVSPYASIRMQPISPAVAEPDELRARSRERYGVDRQEVDAALRELSSPTTSSATDKGDLPLGTRRRPA